MFKINFSEAALLKAFMIKPNVQFQIMLKFHGHFLMDLMLIWSIHIVTTVIQTIVMVGLFVHYLTINLILTQIVAYH